MMIQKTNEQVEQMRKSALLVSKTLTEVARILRPGIDTLSIDKLVGEFIRDHKAVPSFLNYKGYPFNSCISVNDVVVHGFPGKDELKEGDIITVDIGVILDGWHGDHAYTFAIGDPGDDVMKLISVTKESLYRGIEKAIAGNHVGDIAWAIQDYTEKRHG
jgi:methionyl aminopeptidase